MVKKLKKLNMVKSSKLRRLKKAELYKLDLDHSSKVLSMQEDDTEVQEAVEIVTTAKIMTEVVTAATQAIAASTSIPAAKPKILTIAAAPAISTRRRKGVYARKLQEEINKEHEETYKNIDWNAALDHVQSKEPQYIKIYHGMKKKPQTESEPHKNMIFYLKNNEGYKMDFFKGMNINETPAQKAAKKRKLSEEAQEDEDLRKQLEVVEDKYDDVFVKATLLVQKVLVVDYQIVLIDNKPRATQVYKTATLSISTRMMVEHILHEAKDQLLELMLSKRSKKNTKCVNAVSEELTAAKHKLKVVFAAKLPIWNPNEFDLWKMRIEHYFLMTDYSLWEVILNGDSPVPTRLVEGVAQPDAPKTVEQKLARKNELKAHGTLLMALPDKHQLKFNSHKDAKSLM
nr:hypothetical protein [Tanacetum cinerariifolium]